jgi:hypothetical protein
MPDKSNILTLGEVPIRTIKQLGDALRRVQQEIKDIAENNPAPESLDQSRRPWLLPSLYPELPSSNRGEI